MDGFKDSTKTHYSKGGPAGLKGAAKVSQAMRAYKRGGLVESTSARPEKIGLSDEERVAQRAMRSSDLEEREERALLRLPRAKPAPKRNFVPAHSDEPVIQSPLSKRLTTLPSQRGEFTVKR